MSNRTAASALALALGAVLVMGMGSPRAAARERAQIRTVYVSALDKDGVPVPDLSAADFDVKEGGKPREVTGVKRTTTPIRMAVIVADGGRGGFQQGMVSLLQKLQGPTEMSLVSVIEQPDRIVDYTADVDALVEGIQKLGARSNRKSSGQLMDAIVEAVKTLPKPGFRPVLLVMRSQGGAANPTRSEVVLTAIRKAGIRLYVLAPRGAAGGAGGDLEVVLNDGSKETGGRYDEISAPTLGAVADRLADDLLAQYELSYTLPDGVEPTDRLEVTSKRPNVKVQAPTRIAF